MRRAPVLALIAALALAGLLGGCGKRADPRPPDDATEIYRYPRQYPNPGTVLPRGEAPPRSREVISGAGDLSPLPNSRTTVTYGSPAPQ